MYYDVIMYALLLLETDMGSITQQQKYTRTPTYTRILMKYLSKKSIEKFHRMARFPITQPSLRTCISSSGKPIGKHHYSLDTYVGGLCDIKVVWHVVKYLFCVLCQPVPIHLYIQTSQYFIDF